MTDGNERTDDHQEFPEVVKLFPIPNLVLFPHVLQALRVFEERYVELFEAALASDKMIALAVLAPGYELEYEGRPELFSVACLGRITTYTKLPDGTYNFLLQGIQRVQLLEELPPTWSYREARIKPLNDSDTGTPEDRHKLRVQLVDLFRSLLPPSGEAHQRLEELLSEQVPLGALTDIIAYTVEFDLAVKQQLLAETDVCRRATLLSEQLGPRVAAVTARRRPFPPEFSNN